MTDPFELSLDHFLLCYLLILKKLRYFREKAIFICLLSTRARLSGRFCSVDIHNLWENITLNDALVGKISFQNVYAETGV